VGLYASPYPHDAWERIDSTRARSDLVFRIRPELNTRYQLRVEGRPAIRSKVQRVYVDLKGKLTAARFDAWEREHRGSGRTARSR
jgi:hypothetical protein